MIIRLPFGRGVGTRQLHQTLLEAGQCSPVFCSAKFSPEFGYNVVKITKISL